ncbi:hypothetical protein HID58_003016 [Brassica napus]|uniref:Uncharacterized protein n=1 Tax=Brassica napus TaxID=3708 RepID=A0ABQ8ENY2_BRANA|nr:hypothetical protein HID58_003016 [Brassica napus]
MVIRVFTFIETNCYCFVWTIKTSLTRLPMQSRWEVPGLLSGKNPSTVAAGEPPDPPLIPPDPPDPSSPLSPNNFPSLLEAKTIPKSSNYRFGTFQRSGTVLSASSKGIKHPTAVAPKALPAMINGTTACETDSALPPSTVSDFRSVTDTIPALEKEKNLQQDLGLAAVPAASDAPLFDPITAVVPSLAPTPLLSPHQSSFAIIPGLTLNRSASINHSLNPFLTPEPQQRPSLKRSRSSPTLSPPQFNNRISNSNPNPQLKNKLQSFRDTNRTRSSIMMQSWFRFG